MEIYLFRHGIAEDGKPGLSESQRALTQEGRAKTAEVVKLARRSGMRPSLILTSPYVRARQTAAIAAEHLDYTAELTALESLVPHGAPEDVWRDIRDYAHETSILLAGHEPLMGRIAAYLLNAPALKIDMKKAAIVRIDLESLRVAPHGTLRWMIVPKMV